MSMRFRVLEGFDGPGVKNKDFQVGTGTPRNLVRYLFYERDKGRTRSVEQAASAIGVSKTSIRESASRWNGRVGLSLLEKEILCLPADVRSDLCDYRDRLAAARAAATRAVAIEKLTEAEDIFLTSEQSEVANPSAKIL